MIALLRKGRVREAVRERAGSRDYRAVKAALEKMPVLRKLVTSLLKPEVLLPGEFYDRLARDVMEAEDSVIIYSPFTLRPKVMEVLAFIKRSSGRRLTSGRWRRRGSPSRRGRGCTRRPSSSTME